MSMSSEVFYKQRDDRTNLITSADYHTLCVRVVSNVETLSSYSGQVQAILTANMLCRWCRKVEFGFPDVALVKPLRDEKYNTLHERIQVETREADPYGDFRFHKARSSETDYTLKIGSYSCEEQVDFTISADGWNIYVGYDCQEFIAPSRSNNIIGPALSACIGVADAFKVATQTADHLRIKQLKMSLLDFRTSLSDDTVFTSDNIPTHINLGRLQVVGIGSVGSAVIYLLRMLPQVSGHIELIDHDYVEIPNLNRSPLFGISDVGKAKVKVAKTYLHPVISTTAFIGRYDEYIEISGRKPNDVDILLPLANEHDIHTTIENNFPPLQICGTTSSDWEINYHRHIPLVDDCSVCRFPQKIQPVMACSEAPIMQPGGEQVDAALTFLSVAAAVLTVADLVKVQLEGYPFTANFAYIDFKGNFEFVQSYNKRKQQTCMCQYRDLDIHLKYISADTFGVYRKRVDQFMQT